jgi:hypothetical protein
MIGLLRKNAKNYWMRLVLITLTTLQNTKFNQTGDKLFLLKIKMLSVKSMALFHVPFDYVPALSLKTLILY